LVGFFTRRTGDPQLALDLLGETFLTAFEQRRRCRARDDRRQAAWLFRIAANKLNAHYRRGASERRATERFASQLRALTGAELAAIGRLADSSTAGRMGSDRTEVRVTPPPSVWLRCQLGSTGMSPPPSGRRSRATTVARRR